MRTEGEEGNRGVRKGEEERGEVNVLRKGLEAK